jgi:hypothetical protein
MGQATVDLPDPLEKPNATGSADELLAQLAGDEIDRLLADGDAGKPAEPTPAAPIMPAVESVGEVASVPEETDGAERLALAADDVSQHAADLLESEAEVPIFLKPLVWLSSPLDRFGDGLRETIGKIAVLTMVNAIAVLVYVIIFRRHH